MDLQTALICGSVAAISAVVIYVISVFSMREKTYEEAIAEQRKMPEENLLLGRSAKDKAKDKKQKKVGKKVKEKSADHEKNDLNDLPSKPSSVQSAKVHVDFEEPEAEVVSERLPQDDKKKKKREKVKSILLNKNEPVLIENSPLTPSNHFEEILPKDDLLLKRKESREETVLKSNPGPTHENTKQSNPPSVKSTTKVDASNKLEEEKVSSTKLVEIVSASKIERVQSANKEDHESEKKKESAKQDKAPSKPEKLSPKSEKVSPKSEKSSSKPEKAAPKSEASPKPEKDAVSKTEKAVVKSEKPVVNKTEKTAPVKAEKASGKTEKATVEKVEKVASAKVEKTANAKSEKVATKPDSSAPSKSEKSAKQEKKVPQDSAAPPAPEVKEVAPAPAPTPPAPVPAVVVKHEAPVSNAVPPKEKSRKKKSELAALQQMSGGRDGVNMSLLLPIVQKAELSRSEIQILIDHLLNKQQNAGASDAEWIEGRQDPVVKLKKQLAEKEKALAEEQEALQGVQAKLKELRQEFNSERSRLTHSCRQLEENLHAKTNETQTLTARLQHSQEAVNNEKQALTLQVQQLQQKLNEEHVRLCQLQEQDRQVQDEIESQRQQLEMHISRLTEQEKALKAQGAQLMAQVKDLESVNSSLQLELQGLRDSKMSETNLLHERTAHAEKQLLVYKESVERAQELTQQVEDLSIIRGDLEHRLSTSQQHEANLQYEVNNLRKEMEDLKAQLAGYEALKNDSNRLRSENDKLTSQLHQFKDLQLENQRLHDDNERLSSQLVILPQLQKEASQLREENENLAAQVTAMTERPAAEGRENGDIQFHEEKRELPKGDFTLIEKTIQQKEGQVMQLSAELEEKSSLLKQLQSEINTYKTDISKLNSELDEQRRKNNEISQKIYSEQQNATKQLLQRIFPDVRIEDCKNYDKWLEQFESSASKSLSELKSRASTVIPSTPAEKECDVEELEKEKAHLQGLVTNYKAIIDDTAGMLKQLQNQVEEGEIRWRQQLQVKEAELEAVRQEFSASSAQVPSGESAANNLITQSKVEDLQAKLKIHDQEKQDLETKFTSLTRNVEQLKEERNGLSVELKKEQEKSQELSKELVRLRSLVQIGKDSLNQEHEMVVNLQQQVDKLNGVHQNHTVASNGPSTESSVAQGGSGKK